jgi:hypothetical protein
MSHHPACLGEPPVDAMNVHSLDAFENAERLYSAYAKLSELGDLAFLARSEEQKREIIASVSPVLCEHGNALLG